MVVSWLQYSLDKNLQISMGYADDARAMWDELKERYSQGNAQRKHELKKEISRLEQGNDTVVVYYAKLRGLWDELNDYTEDSTCTCGNCTCSAAAKQSRERESEKLHQFLMGLDSEAYNVVTRQILNTEPLPTVNKAFSAVNREEKRKAMRSGPRDDAVAFAAGGGSGRRFNEKLVCEHCDKPGHTKSHCWQLIGYPPDFESRRGGRNGRGRGRSNRGGSQQSGRRETGLFAHGQPSSPAGTITDGGIGGSETAGAVLDVTNGGTGVPILSSEQYREFLNYLNSKTIATERLSGPHLEDADWSG